MMNTYIVAKTIKLSLKINASKENNYGETKNKVH